MGQTETSVVTKGRMALPVSDKRTTMRLLIMMLRLAAFTMTFVASGYRSEPVHKPGFPEFVNNIIGNQTILQGYWHNWCDAVGYRNGTAPCVQLKEVPTDYNVVSVAFTINPGTNIPTFRINGSTGMTRASFFEQVQELNSQHRIVILSLGGAVGEIELKRGQEDELANHIILLVGIYGFNGLDINLVGSSIGAADNPYVIPTALKSVKDRLAAAGTYFTISSSPEFPYLRIGKTYVQYFEALEGYYDWISPQFFNQGNDGIWVPFIGWIAQNDDTLKSDFIFYMSLAIVNGDPIYYQISSDQLVFGIPANNDAAANGYVQNPQDLFYAFGKLKQNDIQLRGIMTWSINWDMGVDASGASYNEAFVKSYGPFLFPKHLSLPHGATS